MTTGKQLAGLLLLTTALTYPGLALAQDTADASAPGAQDSAQPEEADEGATPPADEDYADNQDISIPGGDTIFVTGRISRDPARNSTQVLSVLSAEEIARTGEGDIAGALARVTGLSVVGSGFVYVRGLGDRYSLAMLNGLPLPSPEPLSRVVPLDIFPTDVLASSLVQKTFSANFPGEFGGGVINLTTLAVPDESFFKIEMGLSGDTETTWQPGYGYFGSDTDWTGFDDGSRDDPPALTAFYASGERVNDVDRATQRAMLKDLTNPNFLTLQKIGELPVNVSGSFTAGTSFDVGSDGVLGIIATGGINNSWRNRVILQQFSPNDDLSLTSQFNNWTTDNRVLVNGLVGLGLEIADHRVRFTNLFIRDTLKQSVLGLGTDFESGNNEANQKTAWYERQLLDSQLVAELEFGDLGVDLRGGYAQTQREAPWEYSYEHFDNPDPANPYRGLYQNTLDEQRSRARVVFSDLTEDLYYGGADLSYPVTSWAAVTAGYAYSLTDRYSERREFSFRSSNFPTEFSLFQPAYLLSDAIIDFGEDPANTDPYLIQIFELTQATPAFIAELEVHAGYGQVRLEPTEGLVVDAGVRYEAAVQTVTPDLTVFSDPQGVLPAVTALDNDYFLPGATATYDFGNGLQARLNGSRTLARPQFRELIFQPYQDPETNRLYNGNPLLSDSELTNFEARLEYYLGGGNRALIAGFYKDIDSPIETYSTFADGRVLTSFANAPRAQLIGAEVELEYHYGLENVGGWLSTKELLVLANYTYTQSELKVRPGDTTAVFGSSVTDATLYFRDGAPMTGQSDHLANLQLGIEDSERLQQLTFLITYASERVVSRGFNNLPDIEENPGLRVDFVMREGFEFLNNDFEAKFEVRNIFGRGHEEYQDNGTTRIEVNSYDIGTTFAISLSATF